MSDRNEYLEYCLSMAFADGLLDPAKQAGYLEQLQGWFAGVDLEAEYERIQQNKSRLPSAIRRRIVALVRYEQDKARLGPDVKPERGDGRFM